MDRKIILATVILTCTVACSLSFARAPRARTSEKQVVNVRHFVVPRYAPLARQTLIQGDVSVHIHVGKNGTVESVSDVQGPKLLSDEVTKAVMSWTYDLKTEDSAEVVTIFRFSLEGTNAQETKFVRVSGDLPNLIEIVTNPPQTSWP
jgi:hypothetical protein